MQYKKEAVYDKILAAARAEYLQRGFHGGNISTIAENAGVPVGNLYRYFDGKNGVLDAIVKPAYEAVPKLLSELQGVQVLDSLTLQQIMPLLGGKLLDFFEQFGQDILILVDCCEGTRYADFSQEIVQRVAEIVCAKLYPSSCGKSEIVFSNIIAKAFCGSLFDILRQGADREEMLSMTERLFKFYFFEVDKRK